MGRNLVTRMGTASGLVAALVAAVFAVLVTAVRDQRHASDRARDAERIAATASDLRRDLAIVDLGRRGGLAGAPDVRRARAELPRLTATLRLPSPATTTPAALDRRAAAVVADARATAARERRRADHRGRQAVALGIAGIAGSALLIALLTTYFVRYLVVPVRRTVGAARRLAAGDLSARVEETGASEPMELAQTFNRMAGTLEESERLKDEFFALVSHELRTPLTSIIGYLELVLDDETLSPDVRRFLEIVDRNAKRLLRLVGDMLFVAQVEAGRLSLERREVDLNAVAAEAVEAAQPAAERSRVRLRLEAVPVAPLVGDRDRVGQMLDNLISNAVKFTPDGGSVVVRLREERGSAVLEVADDGVGIPEADRQRIFERFFRASTATERAVPGAGLGLAIVKTIVEAHGGTISIASIEGAGTTVKVDLPHAQAGAAAA